MLIHIKSCSNIKKNLIGSKSMWQTKPVVLATQEFLLLQIVLFLLEKEKLEIVRLVYQIES
jgi:hypothetical protein